MRSHTNSTDKKSGMWRRAVILAAALVTALAVTVTFALCYDRSMPLANAGATQDGVRTSATYTNKTGDLTGQILNNDILEYSAGRSYSVQLPMGTYKLEVYGAKGANSSAGGTGGSGGYSFGTYKVTSAKQQIYIYVGSTGTAGSGTSSAVNAGGFNGGGASGYNGGGGGGATHIATANGALSSLSGNTGSILIVGGGGGGAQNRAGGPGGGGNANGGACPSTSYGTGGCGGGTGGPHGAPNNSHSSGSQSGSFGQGGPGSKGGDGNWGGGGGGGYYGGCGVTTDGSVVDDKGGGGGSGYVKNTLTSIGGTSGNRAAAGLARITAISVNSPPTAKANVSKTINPRGSTSTVTVTASELATDPEGSALYFTNGTAGSYDTMTQSANTGLFINSACTVSASKYFTWTWNSTQQAKLTGCILYPRSGVDGSTANGQITLYSKVRDNFGSTSNRGICTVSFKVTVSTNTVSLKTGTTGNTLVGASANITSPPQNPADATGIYNPNGQGRNTLFINRALVIGQPYTTITAASLLNGVVSYDEALISINSTTAITGSARKYKIQEVDNGSAVTAYNASKGAIPNAYRAITLSCLTPDPNYQVLPVTLYVVEKNTAYGTSNPNTVPNISTISLEIVFKMENTRPVLKSGQTNVVSLGVGQTQAISLNTYFSDADAPSGITSATHSITEVILPKNEFYLLSKQNAAITPAAPNANYYNKGNITSDTFASTAQTDMATGFNDAIVYNQTVPVSGTSVEQAFMRFTYANDVITVTGLRSSFSQYTQSRSSTAPGHFYLMLHIRDMRDTADNGIWLPLAFRIGYDGNGNDTSYGPVATVTDPNSGITGQAKSTLYPKAAGTKDQSFYFAPMAVNVAGSHVIGKYKKDGQLTTEGLQPLALDGDNFTVADGLAARSGKLNEFLRLSDSTTLESIVKSVSEEGYDGSDPNAPENRYIKAEYINIYIEQTVFASGAFGGGRVIAGNGSADANGFKYIPLETASDESGFYITKGLKITLKSATMNRYFYANVAVTDASGKTSAAVDIAIRVANTAPNIKNSQDGGVATYGNRDIDGAYSTYEYGGDVNTPTLTYKIPLGSSFIVTPYDIAFDYDLMKSGAVSPASGFTLNGFNGTYGNGIFTVNGTASGEKQFNGLFDTNSYGGTYISNVTTLLDKVKRPAAVKKASAAADGTAFGTAFTQNASVFTDGLFFARTGDGNDAYTFDPSSYNNIIANASNTTNYISAVYGNKVKVGSDDYPVDFVMFSAVQRTVQPAVVTLTVRDRYGDSSDGNACFTLRIEIEVVNTKPTIKNPYYFKELAVVPVGDKVVDSTVVFSANGNDGKTGLMTDHDGDAPEFLTSRGVLLANTRELINIRGLESFDSDLIRPEWLTDGVNPLTDYVTATMVSRLALSVSAVSSTKALASGVFVYFFVNDNNGGISLGYVQVEVLNSLPALNISETDGFDGNNPLWVIESTNDADITHNRYIAGSQSAKLLLKEHNPISDHGTPVTDDDVKVIASDEDGFHNKTILSQGKVTDGIHEYVNLNEDLSNLAAAVPSITRESIDFAAAPASVVLFTIGSSGSSPGAPVNYNAELWFFIDGEWIARETLVRRLTGLPADDALMRTCFDVEGRWIIEEWALQLQSTEGFKQDKRLGIKLSVRDSAALGGDTAGETTAFDSDRRLDNIDVDGRLVATVYQYISQTGIRSLDEFIGKNNDHYVVDYYNTDDKITTTYVPTYDGDVTSTYPTTLGDIKYSGNVLSSDPDAELIKSRNAGTPDNTLAGTNAGTEYGGETDIAGAFKYNSTIEIPSVVESQTSSDNEHPVYAPVYVPMSYFGLLQTIATPVANTEGEIKVGMVNYPVEYVGYDFGNNSAVVSLDDISKIADSIVLSDGTMSWSGNKADDPNRLSMNPYIDIDTFYYDITQGQCSKDLFLTDRYSEYSRPYYNNRLAVPTVDGKGNLMGYEKYKDDSGNCLNGDSFIGDGKLLYLEEQAEKLKEHNFGLRFAKKNVRTGVRNLTLTLKLAKSSGQHNDVDVDAPEKDRRTVSVNIHIQNSQLDLFADNDDNEYAVKYDGDTYYVDLTMPSSGSKTFALTRRSKASEDLENVPNHSYSAAEKIGYTDDDWASDNYRDYAYFCGDSFAQLDSWTNLGADAHRRAAALDESGRFANTVKTDSAQNSMANYFRVDKNDIANGMAAVTNTFKPNDGIYGTSTEGYSSYFNAALLDGGRVLNIMGMRKTYINEFALDEILTQKHISSPTKQDVIDIYAERGLVAEYAEAATDVKNPTKVYYPFKTLIYDSCGLGWGDGSYVALEFRVNIINGAPTLKEVGDKVGNERELKINLAVGNTVNINLYDIVYDPDMFTTNNGGLSTLATKYYFETNSAGVARETGDYLDSPLDRDEYKTGYRPDNIGVHPDGGYYRNGGGFSPRGSTDRDVIMWMETDTIGGQTVPSSNNISFTVNRRTTARYEGESISINEYRFRLKFFDGKGEFTQYFTFVITITNQSPSIMASNRSFTMRSGDDITVLTSYYDVFTGVTGNKDSAYANSPSKAYMTERESIPGYGETTGDGVNNEDRYWIYRDITTANEGNKVVYDSTVGRDESGNMHLGYYSLADDDTPWRLRITDVSYAQNDRLFIDTQNTLRLRSEGGNGAPYNIAITITAQRACVNEPVTITLSDGEGGVVSCVLYFTIVSSPPVALDYSDADQRDKIRNCGLEGVLEPGTDVYRSATFALFTIADEKGGTFNVEGFTDADGNYVPKQARRVYTIGMSNVAVDPDGDGETNNMTLYRDGCFEVNGSSLVRGSDGLYHSDYFDIRVTDNGRSFEIVATGYDPESEKGYEELTFRIADYGNGDEKNTISVTLYVYTLYADILNDSVSKLNENAYTAYLKGSEKITVKSVDEYYDQSAESVDRSRYAFVRLDGNVGNDGNTASPITDPDVSKAGVKSYAVKLYAFIDIDDQGKMTALSSDTLKNMLVRNGSRGTFALDKSRGSGYTDYVIGGLDVNGEAVSVTGGAQARLNAVLHYADFEFSHDGTSLIFTPKASTLDNDNLLLYVEVEKPLGGRIHKRIDAQMFAGSVFKLNVKDSAPVAVSGNWRMEGKKGDSATYKVHDINDQYNALFVDSDADDIVTISELSDNDYVIAMRRAVTENPGLDWNAGNGKPRAFTIEPTENNCIKITINRRIDMKDDKTGAYKPYVEFPIELTGKDIMNRAATAVITLRIYNSDISAVESKTVMDENNVGYTFERAPDGTYNMNVNIRRRDSVSVMLSDFIVDADYSGETADTDSYRFVKLESAFPYVSLTDEIERVSWFDTNADGTPNHDISREIATVEPLGADAWHRTGFKLTAMASVRSLKATMYVRIADRSADTQQPDTGIVVKVDIVVMNDAPFVLENKETTTVYMMGSDKGAPGGMLFYIGDFVSDNNTSDVVGDAASGLLENRDTYLRIYRQESKPVRSLYSTMYDSVKEGADNIDADSSSLFTVTIPNALDIDLIYDYCDRNGLSYDFKDTTNMYNQWFVLTPNQGFYGEGEVDITVADGDTNILYDTLTTTFRLNVHVIYNAEETENALNPQTVACSKTLTLDIGSLMPDLPNKLIMENGEVSARAGGDVFSQSKYYRLTNIAIQSEYEKNKATITQVGDTSTWTLKAGNQITVEPIRVNVSFVLESDPDGKVYNKMFWLTIIANKAPKMRYSEITFRRNGNKDDPDMLRDLNSTGTIKLRAYQLFTDEDDPEGNALRLLGVRSQVSSIVKVSLEKNANGENEFVVITFVGRGESEITIDVTDETGNPVSLTFLARNEDMPQASLWIRIMASFEGHKVIWTVMIGCVLLVIVVLIVIIAVLRKRKREREELEALLVSEMEIEEQMLKLAGGPAPTGYQSFGYLPPVEQPQENAMMLDAGVDPNGGEPPIGALPPAQSADDGSENI